MSSVRTNLGKTCRAIGLLLVLASGGPGAAFSSGTGGPDLAEYVSEGRYFKCLLPAGWSRYEAPDHSREVSKVYGLEVYEGASDQLVSISVKYYAPDNMLHKSVEKFIRVHAGPVLGYQEEGDRYGPVNEVLFKGVRAKAFERTKYEYDRHGSVPIAGRRYRPVDPRQYAMRERFIVIPAPRGFYVLRYKASPDAGKDREEIFERVLASFEGLVK